MNMTGQTFGADTISSLYNQNQNSGQGVTAGQSFDKNFINQASKNHNAMMKTGGFSG